MLSLEIILSFVIFCNKNVKRDIHEGMSLFSVFYFTLYSVFSRQYPVLLEQSCNLSSSVYIDTLCCRNFRQTWHGHDVTGQGYDEACTSGDFQVTYGNFESGRCAEFGLIIGQAVLGFAIQIGQLPNPRASNCFACFCAFAVRTTLLPP